MATATSLEDSLKYMIEYHPYNDGKNPNHTKGSDSQTLVFLKDGRYSDSASFLERKSKFQRRIKLWVRGIIDEESNKDNVVIAIAPGHSPSSKPNFLHEIIGSVSHKQSMDGRKLLYRAEEVEKAAHGGRRDQSRHEETICISSPKSVKRKVVYIIDDVWTTGATLRACATIMKKAGAAQVYLLAVGKTVHMD